MQEPAKVEKREDVLRCMKKSKRDIDEARAMAQRANERGKSSDNFRLCLTIELSRVLRPTTGFWLNQKKNSSDGSSAWRCRFDETRMMVMVFEALV